MKLHLDRDAFDVFIENIHERCSYRSDVLPGDFTFFTQAAQDKNVCNAYEKMLRQYVMRNEDRINLAEVNSSLGRIEAKLLKNPAWLECKLPKKK